MAPETIEIRSKELQALFDYWQGKRGDRLAPSRNDIAPTEIKAQLPRIFIVDVVPDDPPRFRFRLAGTAVVDRFGEEITGRFLDELDLDHLGREISRDYARIIQIKQPICSRWNYVKNDGRLLRYERLLLPLSADGKSVDMILGAAAEEPSGAPAD